MSASEEDAVWEVETTDDALVLYRPEGGLGWIECTGMASGTGQTGRTGPRTTTLLTQITFRTSFLLLISLTPHLRSHAVQNRTLTTVSYYLYFLTFTLFFRYFIRNTPRTATNIIPLFYISILFISAFSLIFYILLSLYIIPHYLTFLLLYVIHIWFILLIIIINIIICFCFLF